MSRRLFLELIAKTRNNDEVAFNLFLVSRGGRKATLIEAADYKQEDFDIFVDVATRHVPHVECKWERKNDADGLPIVCWL